MPPEDPPAKDDPPKALTAEEIGNLINAAIVSHDSRNAKKRSEELTKLIADAVKSAAPPPPPPPPGPSGPGGGEPKPGSPELAALQAKVDASERETKKLLDQVKAEREAREAAETKARDDRTFNDFRASLAPHVRPDMLDDLARLHFYADKRVTYDEEGRALYKAKRAPGPGLPEEEVAMPLADGVGFWLKSKDAARYLPAPGGGSGAGAGAAGGSPGAMTPRGGRPPPAPRYTTPARDDDERARRAYEHEQELIARGVTT